MIKLILIQWWSIQFNLPHLIIFLPKRLCYISNQNIFLWKCMLVCPSWKLLYKNKQIKVLRFAWRCVCISTWINGHLYGTNKNIRKMLSAIFFHTIFLILVQKSEICIKYLSKDCLKFSKWKVNGIDFSYTYKMRLTNEFMILLLI